MSAPNVNGRLSGTSFPEAFAIGAASMLLVCSIVASQWGPMSRRSKAEAVNAGAAEWVREENGQMRFEWIDSRVPAGTKR